MFGDAEIGNGPIGVFATVGEPIIFEVTLAGKELVFAVEISLISASSRSSRITTTTDAIQRPCGLCRQQVSVWRELGYVLTRGAMNG